MSGLMPWRPNTERMALKCSNPYLVFISTLMMTKKRPMQLPSTMAAMPALRPRK